MFWVDFSTLANFSRILGSFRLFGFSGYLFNPLPRFHPQDFEGSSWESPTLLASILGQWKVFAMPAAQLDSLPEGCPGCKVLLQSHAVKLQAQAKLWVMIAFQNGNFPK